MRILTELGVTEISLVNDPANPGAKITFFKRKEAEMSNTTGGREPRAFEVAWKNFYDSFVRYFDSCQAAQHAAGNRDLILDQLQYLVWYAGEEPEGRRLYNAFVSAATSQADLWKAIERIAQMRIKKNSRARISKAGAVAEVLNTEIGRALYGEMRQLPELGGYDDEIAKAEEPRAEGEAWLKIEKRAELARKADPSLTKASAVTTVLTEEPELYLQYLAEVG